MGKRSTKYYRKNEADVMKRLGFKPTRNSGAGWIEKADGQSEHCICELKSTDKESFSIKQEYLRGLEYHASVTHKLPVFAFQFLNTDEVWVAIKESDIEAFKKLLLGQQIHEQFIDLPVDMEQEQSYNKDNDSKTDTNVSKSYMARKNYQKQMERQKEQREKEYKERIKERRNKKFGKEI